MDYNNLIKQLRNTHSRSKRELMDKAADAIEDLEQKFNALNSVTVQEWIPVKERLPTREDANETESIIAIHKDYGYASKWIWDIVARYPTEFTHWMPMPEAPKERIDEIILQQDEMLKRRDALKGKKEGRSDG